MKQNVLQISVTAAPEEQTDALSAGKMYEHNATALMFTLEESLVLPTYRYYAEFEKQDIRHRRKGCLHDERAKNPGHERRRAGCGNEPPQHRHYL